MRFYAIASLLVLSIVGHSANAADCDFIQKERDVFKAIAPSGIAIYKHELSDCNVLKINGVPINDYFLLESDALLGLFYVGMAQQLTHPRLLDYLVQNERWDLLLLTLDSMRTYKKNNQIKAMNHLFYMALPYYFNVELKEIFNFFSATEKIAVSQQLIPSNAKEVKFLNKRNNYIYEFWPLFDQMVYMNHLRELYPYQFEKLAVFWREKLVSYHYDGVEKQDPSFKLLSNLLNRDVVKTPVLGANKSLQLYYFIKLNLFDSASEFMNKNDKRIFFNTLRYFELFDARQQNYLMTLPIQFSISDIKRLFHSFYFQLDHPSFRQWVWQVAYENKFNCEKYLDDPYRYLKDVPFDYIRMLPVIAPLFNVVNKGAGRVDHYFLNDPTNQTFKGNLDKKDIAFISRFYNDFKRLPLKDQRPIITSILPFITIERYQEYLDVLPYLTTTQKIDLIDRFELLEHVPTAYRAQWSRWLQSNLTRPPKKD